MYLPRPFIVIKQNECIIAVVLGRRKRTADVSTAGRGIYMFGSSRKPLPSSVYDPRFLLSFSYDLYAPMLAMMSQNCFLSTC